MNNNQNSPLERQNYLINLKMQIFLILVQLFEIIKAIIFFNNLTLLTLKTEKNN